MKKIAIIGAGSAIFSLNLIKDICLCDNLRDSTISLMDVDEARLDAITGLCVRYAEETGHPLRIEKTMDRRQAIQGADFVINVALDYGHARLREGWEVAYRHGYRFGGSLHVVHDEAFWVNWHQMRLMESILKDVLEICPNAWYILVANPVLAAVTHLKRKYPQANLVGMCHGFGGVYWLAKAMGMEKQDVTFECVGVNHFVWLTKFYHKGEDALPLLQDWVENKSADYFKTAGISDGNGPKAVDLYRRYGVFPIGDTCTPGGGSWGWWYHTDGEEARWNEDPKTWYDGYFTHGLAQVEKIRQVVADRSVRVMDAFSDIPSDEPMVPLIEALACDVERVVIVNVPNVGSLVPGIPEDFEVEIPALVSRKGIQGIRTDGLPKPVMACLWRDRIATVETELLAYETGNRDRLVDLVMCDPWTTSRKQAEEFVAAILDMPCNHAMKAFFEG